MIRHKYNPRKATEAACVLLNLAGGKINYTVLIKLLYLVDRNAIDRWGKSVTTDSIVSMENGLVLSHILNHVKKYKPEAQLRKIWKKHISGRRGHSVILLEKPNIEELSQREINLLKEIYENYFHLGLRLIDFHHQLPEWINPGKFSIPVPIENILKVLGKSKTEISIIAEEIILENLHEEVISMA